MQFLKFHIYGEDEAVHYLNGEEERKKGLYIRIGCFITSYAREKTIRTSQAITDYSLKKYGVDKYIYSDTDSIHTLLSIDKLKQFCKIDDVELRCLEERRICNKRKIYKTEMLYRRNGQRSKNYLLWYAKGLL